jgi:hypothetical protein
MQQAAEPELVLEHADDVLVCIAKSRDDPQPQSMYGHSPMPSKTFQINEVILTAVRSLGGGSSPGCRCRGARDARAASIEARTVRPNGTRLGTCQDCHIGAVWGLDRCSLGCCKSR